MKLNYAILNTSFKISVQNKCNNIENTSYLLILKDLSHSFCTLKFDTDMLCIFSSCQNSSAIFIERLKCFLCCFFVACSMSDKKVYEVGVNKST
mmetsp:Transcript_37742/g.45599  ORF Transcript_37742/g.45599 Transcript_37742/m.45599 type:complete len:94 (-) Transcript_37742:1365-1646(-)